MDMHALMAKAADETARLVRGITDADLGRPTPCADYDVRTLVSHLYGVLVMFEAFGRKQAPPEGVLERDHVVGDWRSGFERQAKQLVEAWADPAAHEGVTPGLGLPMTVAAQMVFTDLVVHGWDLARATGQEYTVAPDVQDAVHESYTTMTVMGREHGVFGAPVAVAGDASPLVKALGLSGRDPSWTPPAA